MKKNSWTFLDVDRLATKSQDERFAFFSRAIRRDDGSVMFAGNLLQRAAALYPDSIALIYKDRTISYQELYQRSALFSKKLLSLGVQPKDRVLLLFPNSLEFYIAYFGAWQVGAVVAPLNIFLQERELKHIVQDADPALIVTTTEKRSLFGAPNIPVLTEEDLELEGPLPEADDQFDVVSLAEDDLAALLYTSGTTGLPKGVMLSSKNIMTNVAHVLARMPLNSSERLFCALPLFHSFAQNTCVWSAFFPGCSVVLVPKIDRRSIFDGLQHKPTIFLGVPALYGLLCLLKTAPLDAVEYFICGGDALPNKIRAGFELIYRRKLCNGYGLTETSPLISVDFDDLSEPTNNVGKPVPGVVCSIRDEHGHELPLGQIGMLWVKGDNVMMGYYNAPEKTKEVLQDGWFCTGDLAKFDGNGKLLICGRDKDLIIHKGLNIYPQEVENVILGHMSVLYVGVVGKHEEMHGEIPVAFVQLHPGKRSEGVEQELRLLCKKNLAPYKLPRSYMFIEDMPLTATNKVDKKQLRYRFGK